MKMSTPTGEQAAILAAIMSNPDNAKIIAEEIVANRHEDLTDLKLAKRQIDDRIEDLKKQARHHQQEAF